jgi:hypothetical protein
MENKPIHAWISGTKGSYAGTIPKETQRPM